MNHASHRNCLTRLRRIEGQTRGIARMVEEERYCIDILTQIQAVVAALKRVEDQILREHVEHCVEHALESGDDAEKHAKIDELLTVFSRRSG